MQMTKNCPHTEWQQVPRGPGPKPFDWLVWLVWQCFNRMRGLMMAHDMRDIYLPTIEHEGGDLIWTDRVADRGAACTLRIGKEQTE